MRMEKTMNVGADSIDLRPVDLMRRMATGKNHKRQHSAMRSWVGKNGPSF